MCVMTERRIRHLPVVERGPPRGHHLDRRHRQSPARRAVPREPLPEELHPVVTVGQTFLSAARSVETRKTGMSAPLRLDPPQFARQRKVHVFVAERAAFDRRAVAVCEIVHALLDDRLGGAAPAVMTTVLDAVEPALVDVGRAVDQLGRRRPLPGPSPSAAGCWSCSGCPEPAPGRPRRRAG